MPINISGNNKYDGVWIVSKDCGDRYTGIALTGLFQFIGNDTTHEVRLGRPQRCHQVVQLLLVTIEGVLVDVLANNLIEIKSYFKQQTALFTGNNIPKYHFINDETNFDEEK